MRLPFKHIAYLLLGFFLASCADDIEDLYAPWSVRFVFNQVNTTAPLLSALNNPGQFCQITFPNGKYLFKDHDGNEVLYTPTATFGYSRPDGFLSGIIVAVLPFRILRDKAESPTSWPVPIATIIPKLPVPFISPQSPPCNAPVAVAFTTSTMPETSSTARVAPFIVTARCNTTCRPAR